MSATGCSVRVEFRHRIDGSKVNVYRHGVVVDDVSEEELVAEAREQGGRGWSRLPEEEFTVKRVQVI